MPPCLLRLDKGWEGCIDENGAFHPYSPVVRFNIRIQSRRALMRMKESKDNWKILALVEVWI